MPATKSSFGLFATDLQNICQIFAGFPQIKEVIVYGSRAKGNFRPGSDLDLVVFGDNLDLSILNRISSELEELSLPIHIDLSIYDYIENQALREHIQRVGKKLMDG